MAVRLKDVASHAGVSIKSVSNVVHEHPGVSAALRDRVQASLDELGYRPNVSARSLRTGRTGTIGLAVPRLTDAYFAEIAHHVVDASEQRGWNVLVEETGEDPGREAAVLAGLRPLSIDGLIFSPLTLDQQALHQAVSGTPLVLIGEHLADVGLPRVGIDNVAAARDAVLHLASLGRTRIAVIGLQRGPAAATAELRYAGYLAGLQQAGIRRRPQYERPVDRFQRPDGAHATRTLLGLRVRPDAIFCFNDLLAIGALRAMYRAGVRVPDDVAVIGLDDIPEGEYAVPSLTTVAQDKGDIARRAVACLGDRIRDPEAPVPPYTVVAHRLVIRESTGPGSAPVGRA